MLCDQRKRPVHADEPDKGVLPSFAVRGHSHGHDPIPGRVARDEFAAVELLAGTTVLAEVVREVGDAQGAGGGVGGGRGKMRLGQFLIEDVRCLRGPQEVRIRSADVPSGGKQHGKNDV